MGRFIVLMTTELRLLARNRTAAVTAAAVPLAVSALWLFQLDPSTPEEWGAMFSVQLVLILAYSVYVTATTTVVARRHGLVLKRLRTTEMSKPALLLATIAPGVVIGIAQLAVIGVADAIVGAPAPAHPEVLAVAILLGVVLCTTAALATAVLTPSPERAQITTLPLTLVLLGGSFAIAEVDSESLRQALVAVPGLGIGELSRLAQGGGAWDDSVGGVPALAPALASLIAWPIAFAAIARRRFAWDQRR